ncbi:MAG: hypothetical protein IIC01_06175 [Planctomycetes bacterium]|nr:hypothetical protein [Planctomycetota bacterium]
MPNSVQAEGSASAAVGGLQDRFPGLSTLMDEDGAVAFFGKPMTAAATPAEAARAWLSDHGAALGVPDPDLRIERENAVGVSGRTVIAYRQFLDGLPVEYGIARLLVREDRLSRVVFAAARLVRRPKGGFAIDRVGEAEALATVRRMAPYAGLTQWSAAQLVVFQDGPNFARSRAIRAWKFLGVRPDSGDFEAYTFFVNAADGSLAHVRSEVYHGGNDIAGRVSGFGSPGTLPDAPLNNPVSLDLIDLQLNSEFGSSAVTDRNGQYVMQNNEAGVVKIEAKFQGLFVNVQDTAGPVLPSLFQNVVPPGPADFNFNTNPSEFSTAQINTFVHTTATHNFFKDRQPGFTEIDIALTAQVNQASTCNAFFTPIGPSINFFVAGAGCVNTAFSTVIGHEYAHFVVSVLGLRQGAFGEGFGDAVVLLQYDDPIVGRDFFGPGTFVRDIVGANKRYPCFGEVHDCGQVLAGVWWDIKLEMQGSLGQSTGLQTAQQLLTDWSQITLGGSGRNSASPRTAVEVLTVDDDDGDLDNGSPHFDEICAGFAAHNIRCPGTCDEIRRLRVSCLSGLSGSISPLREGNVIRATITTQGAAGSEVTLVLDETDSQTVTIGDRRRTTVRWSNVSEGEHEVCIEDCPGLCRSVTCGP